MNQKKKVRDIFVVGFALFAMFLGAANIIFPPYLGARSGSAWLLAGLGFILTGTGLPLLGIVATARAGGNAEDISARVSARFSRGFITLLILFIGPLFAVPRTAATTVELSVLPFLPEQTPHLPVLIIGSGVFFAICLSFVLNPSKAIDKIGNYLTPVLLVFLLSLIALSIVRPIGVPGDPDPEFLEKGMFYQGFTTGYQTMDALASILFCATVFHSLTQKGYSEDETKKMMLPIAILAAAGTTIVYSGFIWIGASASRELSGIQDFSSLTVAAVTLLAGIYGRIILAIIIFLACCTTAIGLIMTCSEYFYKIGNGKYRYKSIAILVTFLAYAISIIGVDGIIGLAAPVLEVMYPAVIVLIVLNLFGTRIKHDYAFHGALIAALPATVLNVLRLYKTTRPIADRWLSFFPLGDAGFGAFIPAVGGAIIGMLIGLQIEKKKKASQKITG